MNDSPDRTWKKPNSLFREPHQPQRLGNGPHQPTPARPRIAARNGAHFDTRMGAPGLWVLALMCLAALSSAPCRAADNPAIPRDNPGWDTPKQFQHLAPHPRLFASEAMVQRMVKGRGPAYAEDYAQVKAAADTGVQDQDDPLSNPDLFKGTFKPLTRSFLIFGRLVSLAEQWHISHDRKYLDAAVKNILGMKDWLPPDGGIELWQGQEIAAIAITYDLIYNDLNATQREELVAFARVHCIQPFLMNTGSRSHPMVEGEHGSWWQNKVINWNPVCSAGAGMLALTMYEDLPEAQTVIDRVRRSYEPILDYLQKTQGGWWEGLGYWNWTMHYLSLFYVSYERATGQQVPGFHSQAYREAMLFGTYFVPYAQACGFGDNQHGYFSSSVLMAAQFLGDKDLLKRLQDYHARFDKYTRLNQDQAKKPQPQTQARPAHSTPKMTNINYGPPLDLLITPDPETNVPAPQPQDNFVKIYPGLGWAVIADQWPLPNIYASVRGGPIGNSGGHAYNDLMSWNGVVGGERMIVSYNHAGYYGPSFGSRAWDIYERSQSSKNTIFVAGLPAAQNRRDTAQAAESQFLLPTGAALRLDARSAYGGRFVGRLFALLGHRGLLVLDRVEPADGPVEVRTHTLCGAIFSKDSVLLQTGQQTARMTFAADQPAKLRRAEDLLTDANATPPTMMRWQTLGTPRNVSMASVLTPGSDPIDVTVQSDDTLITVTVKGHDWQKVVRVTTRLEAPPQTQ